MDSSGNKKKTMILQYYFVSRKTLFSFIMALWTNEGASDISITQWSHTELFNEERNGGLHKQIQWFNWASKEKCLIKIHWYSHHTICNFLHHSKESLSYQQQALRSSHSHISMDEYPSTSFDLFFISWIMKNE